MPTKRLAAALFPALVAALPAFAACPSPADINALAADWLNKQPATAPALDDLADAYCGQNLLVAALKPAMGPIVGYKAALTTKPAQERFGVAHPVRGALLQNMLLPDGAAVAADFGTRPLWEADLLAVVKDDGLNGATTQAEALSRLSAVVPFIELPDLTVKPEIKVDGPTLTLINAGARAGVVGAQIPLFDDAATLAALAEVKITATDETGAVLAQGTGAMALGHPLNAVLWLVKDLNAAGIRVKAGDVLSLGSFSPLTPPKPGQTVTVRYDGLPGGAGSVSVRFLSR
jgi:2-keto-4-pentenoate hydratase